MMYVIHDLGGDIVLLFVYYVMFLVCVFLCMSLLSNKSDCSVYYFYHHHSCYCL